MKRNIWLTITFVLLFLAIAVIRSGQHSWRAFQDKPVWKELSLNELSELDTLFVNWNGHKGLIHPTRMVWKMAFLNDSIQPKNTNEANARTRIETKPSLNRQMKMQVANQQ